MLCVEIAVNAGNKGHSPSKPFQKRRHLRGEGLKRKLNSIFRREVASVFQEPWRHLFAFMNGGSGGGTRNGRK